MSYSKKLNIPIDLLIDVAGLLKECKIDAHLNGSNNEEGFIVLLISFDNSKAHQQAEKIIENWIYNYELFISGTT